jgi:uncharacterized protein YbjT (DUF2867 family)
MKILLTGATGYIGKRLLPVLVEKGHEVICCVRDPKRFNPPLSIRGKIKIIQVDFLEEETLHNIPYDIDGAYYLIHSMSSTKDYKSQEKNSAVNFRTALDKRNVEHVIFLSGIINESVLSEHLESRKNVELELAKGRYNFTTLRAAIIIGSGSASFEIIRDLVEKLPLMIAPKWLNTKSQPIGISDVISFLSDSLFHKETYNQNFDIGGQDVLTYIQMLLGYAKVRNLNRRIFTVPVMTPRLSSYWLYFVTSTSYKLAVNLVDSMKVEVVCRDHKINSILNKEPIPYQLALEKAFKKIENNEILSSWKDANVSSNFNPIISDYIRVPTFGCFLDKRERKVENRELCIEKIWRIGGKNGWYYGNYLWQLRGYLDKLAGGVGLRRGRTNINDINVGDALDFWRVLYANKEEGRLLLYAEMKLPGEAWLEFKIKDNKLVQTATFRPLGILGRVYWYSVLPFHGFIFKGMLKRLVENKS